MTFRRASASSWIHRERQADHPCSGAILRDTAEMFYNERLTTNAPYGVPIDIPSPAGGLHESVSGLSRRQSIPRQSAAVIPFAGSGVYVKMPLQTNQLTWPSGTQLSAPDHDELAGFGKLSRQQDHAPLGRTKTSTSHLYTGHVQRQTVFHHSQYQPAPTALSAESTEGAAYASIVQSDQDGNSSYNGLLLSLQHRFSDGFTLLSNYTWSHCISDVDFTGELAGSAYPDPSNRASNRGDCNFDIRHVFNTSLIAVSSAHGDGWTARLLRNWQLSPAIRNRLQ